MSQISILEHILLNWKNLPIFQLVICPLVLIHVVSDSLIYPAGNNHLPWRGRSALWRGEFSLVISKSWGRVCRWRGTSAEMAVWERVGCLGHYEQFNVASGNLCVVEGDEKGKDHSWVNEWMNEWVRKSIVPRVAVFSPRWLFFSPPSWCVGCNLS